MRPEATKEGSAPRRPDFRLDHDGCAGCHRTARRTVDDMDLRGVLGRSDPRLWGGLLLTSVVLAVAWMMAALGPGYFTGIDQPWWSPVAWPVIATVVAVQLGLTVWLMAAVCRPERAAVLVSAATVVLVLAGHAWPRLMFPATNATVPWIPAAAYTVGSVLPWGRPWTRSARSAYVAVLLAAVLATGPWQQDWNAIAQGLLLFAAPLLVGLYVAARRRLVCELRAKVDAAQREQYLLAARARAEERARLAEEMHDVVTHRVSLMVLQAGALRVTSSDPVTRVAAEELRAAGVQALDELRDLVGVLRDPDRELAVPGSPTAPDVDALVAGSVGAGLTVRLDAAGDPASASPIVARTVYRIVQEALTNVGKHAPDAQTTVRLRYGPTGVRVRVLSAAGMPARVTVGPAGGSPPQLDPVAPRRDPDLAATGSGRGLAGLARRVELMSGTFRAGPDGAGRFLVEADLPAFVPSTPSSADVVR
jgi:signal transduction histidine kinase